MEPLHYYDRALLDLFETVKQIEEDYKKNLYTDGNGAERRTRAAKALLHLIDRYDVDLEEMTKEVTV